LFVAKVVNNGPFRLFPIDLKGLVKGAISSYDPEMPVEYEYRASD
jgi:hypothetical protein